MSEIPKWIKQTYIALLKNKSKATDVIVAADGITADGKIGEYSLIYKVSDHIKGFTKKNHLQEFIDRLSGEKQ